MITQNLCESYINKAASIKKTGKVVINACGFLSYWDKMQHWAPVVGAVQTKLFIYLFKDNRNEFDFYITDY